MPADSILTRELKPYIRYADHLAYHQWTTPKRIITDYLLLYVREGSLRLETLEGSHILKPGQFLFVQPGFVHQFESLSPLSVLALHVELFPSGAGEHPPIMIAVDQGQSPAVDGMQPPFTAFADISVPLIIQPSKPVWMIESLETIIEHWRRKNAIDHLQANVRAAEIMIEILRDHTLQGAAEMKSMTDLGWVPAYMQYRLSEPLSVEEMAHKAFMSRSYFSRLFSLQFGLAPHQYLLRLRLDSATDLLKGTGMALQDIADHCGFSSVHHFSKMYKLRYGFPPSHIRLPN